VRKAPSSARKTPSTHTTPRTASRDASAKPRQATRTAAGSKRTKRQPGPALYGENEIRQDYLLDFKVLIAKNRIKRPQEFAAPGAMPKERADDPFLPGNEHLSTPEIGRIGTEHAWQIRWFENRYPFFNPQGTREASKYNPLLQSESAVGFHEIVVGTPIKNRQFWDFTPKQIEALVRVYQSEVERLQEKGYKFVQIFKNHGASAGTSIIHEHTQIVALPFIPPRIEEEISAAARYFRSRRRCAYCDVIKEEKQAEERIAYENDTFIVICPYASRYNFEAHLYPKIHKSSFKELLPKDYEGLADAMAYVLKRLKKLKLSFNIEFHYEPMSKAYKEKNSGLHFHIEVLPRRQVWGGFELGTSIIVNEVSPEMAAAYYRTGR
jgi:UDPglucose--hexose-1-phosphate uridylyltransferase